MAFVQWLREQEERYNNMRFDVTAYSKYDHTKSETASNFFGDTLANELEEAVWALCKIKAAAALRRDLGYITEDPED